MRRKPCRSSNNSFHETFAAIGGYFCMDSQVLGIVAGVFTSTGMLPQLIKIIKTKEAEDISMFMLLVLFVGFCLWIWYAVEKDDLPVLLSNSVSLTLTIVTSIFTIKYKKKK